MNRRELESILKRARVPEISEDSLEMFPRQTAARLKRGEPQELRARKFAPRFGWAFGLAACIVVAFAIGHWSGRMTARPVTTPDSLASMKLIRETLAMFPNQVRAIVEDEHGIHLVLSDKPDVPASAPIYVQISDGKQSTSLVTFSGQDVQIAGQQVTVLADGNGGVILAGQHFVWSDSGRVYAEGNLRIKAENLGSVPL
ncbi:MAG TPA: hypothetical protein VFY06_01895 [Verrucomicrobiae bacterium]|nr:hypothetical protein [Verrucomicrobiae bacterium]